MKIRNSVFENQKFFETLGKVHTSDKLSIMDAYRINRLVKKINELNEEYVELKKKLLDQHGKPAETEGQYEIAVDSRVEFAKEMSDLLNIEHDLESEKLPFPQKFGDEGISSSDIDVLDMFFDLSSFEEESTSQEKEEKEEEPTSSDTT